MSSSFAIKKEPDFIIWPLKVQTFHTKTMDWKNWIVLKSITQKMRNQQKSKQAINVQQRSTDHARLSDHDSQNKACENKQTVHRPPTGAQSECGCHRGAAPSWGPPKGMGVLASRPHLQVNPRVTADRYRGGLGCDLNFRWKGRSFVRWYEGLYFLTRFSKFRCVHMNLDELWKSPIKLIFDMSLNNYKFYLHVKSFNLDDILSV